MLKPKSERDKSDTNKQRTISRRKKTTPDDAAADYIASEEDDDDNSEAANPEVRKVKGGKDVTDDLLQNEAWSGFNGSPPSTPSEIGKSKGRTIRYSEGGGGGGGEIF